MPPKGPRHYALSPELKEMINQCCEGVLIHRGCDVSWGDLVKMFHDTYVAVHHDHNTTIYCALGESGKGELHSVVWMYPGDRAFHLMFNTFMRENKKIAMLHAQRSPLVKILQCQCMTPVMGSCSLAIPYNESTREIYNTAGKRCVLSSFYLEEIIVSMLTADTVRLRRKMLLQLEEKLLRIREEEEADCVIEENDHCCEELPEYGANKGLLKVKLERHNVAEGQEGSSVGGSTFETESTTYLSMLSMDSSFSNVKESTDSEIEGPTDYIPIEYCPVDESEPAEPTEPPAPTVSRSDLKRPLSPGSDSSESEDANVFDVALKRERRASVW
eukprot:TRINITY_DN22725_c0_g1_i1.p1 TRINITY_DN22725_c0_g1~~TRINITY_DN22725_c0_g1_i1.p1  ORF type:complete len:330 (+),score=46.64 TRINITY_DN22725_c0_g1_i1:48-1037(+)